MIKHIVLFKLKDTHNLQKAKQALANLKNDISELIDLEVGINFTQSERAFDLSLITTFDNKDDLSTYQNHPKHQPVVSLMREICEKSHVVDYEF